MRAVSITVIVCEADNNRIGHNHLVVAHDGYLSGFAYPNEHRATRIRGKGDKGILDTQRTDVGDHRRAKPVFGHPEGRDRDVQCELKELLNQQQRSQEEGGKGVHDLLHLEVLFVPVLAQVICP